MNFRCSMRVKVRPRTIQFLTFAIVLLFCVSNYIRLTYRLSGEVEDDSDNLVSSLTQEKATLLSSKMDSTTVVKRNSTFSACLLVMDDNHFLIEWIAFHYFALPLRYLVVAVDPRSRTSPGHVLDRWRKYMTIVEWKDRDYMTRRERERAEQAVKEINPNVSAEVLQHRARQRLFYDKCMRHLRRKGRDWTALIDTDEFLMLNYETIDNRGQLDQAPDMDAPGSVLKFLEQSQRITSNRKWLQQSPCIPVPRIRFGRRESHPYVRERQVPPSFNASQFQTLRWRKHASPRNKQMNKFSKVLVDVSRMELEKLAPVSDIHRPYKKYCTFAGKHILGSEQVFIIHHYLGTWEQYSYRDDPREGMQRSRDLYLALGDVNHGKHDGIRPWLQGFVNAMGNETAIALLKDVGVLEPRPPKGEVWRQYQQTAFAFRKNQTSLARKNQTIARAAVQ